MALLSLGLAPTLAVLGGLLGLYILVSLPINPHFEYISMPGKEGFYCNKVKNLHFFLSNSVQFI